ncbi:MAG: EAL domain-containing protein [Lachnospiraceae bacterium]|nr:EAL domain-containing protein [Lachnospiraceae bacterium]
MMDQKFPEEAKRRLDSLFESYAIIAENTYVYLCDMRYNYSRWSKALVKAFDLPSEYMYDAGLIWEEHIHPEDREAYHRGLDDVFSGKQNAHDMQYRARRPDGGYDLCTCRGIVIKDEDGEPVYFGGTIRNHSDKNYIDTLTGLRNRNGFFLDIQNYIQNKTTIMIGMAGFSKFSNINEIYGYEVGNKVLQHFGRYLMENVSNREGTYRLDGSRFAVISVVQEEKKPEQSYEKLRSYFRKGINVDGNDIILELNGGVVYLDSFNVDYRTVLSCLNYAYQDSKRNKHGDLVTFGRELTGDNRKELEKLYAVHKSVAKELEGFYLLYQPVVDAETEKIIGAEALLRWKSDEYGTLPPDAIIPFLETDPIFPVLGEWILCKALEDAKKIMEYIPDFKININLSYTQVEKADFTDSVWNAINKTGIGPEHVCLEMTERCRLLDMNLLSDVITRLRTGGVKIALDDFGTGYSSVGLITKLTFDTIKIDRSFVQNIEQDEQEKRLLYNFTDMAGAFGANVCVEGIETAGIRDILRTYGVHSFQGYYYSKPITIEEFLDKVRG